MTRSPLRVFLSAVAAACMLSGCGTADAPGNNAVTTAVNEAASVIPASLAPTGDGYPEPGSPCRQLGESPATARYLDDSSILVGCPTEADAAALNGKIVGTQAGVTLVSVPTAAARAAMEQNGPPPPPDSGDALVAGTDYNATTDLPCGFANAAPTGRCAAGVKRGAGPDGTTIVEITRPDGGKRTIMFKGVTPTGADGSQANGSAGWKLQTTRKGDETTIRFGPETYVVVDALIEGG